MPYIPFTARKIFDLKYKKKMEMEQELSEMSEGVVMGDYREDQLVEMDMSAGAFMKQLYALGAYPVLFVLGFDWIAKTAASKKNTPLF